MTVKVNARTKIAVCAILLQLAGCAHSHSQYEPGETNSRIEERALEVAFNVEQKMRSKYVLSTDHAANERINRITQKLRAHSTRPDALTHTYLIANSSYVNAATGGRDIFFGERLMRELRTDERIAFVLAHEMSHIDRFHPLRSYESARRRKWYTFGLTQAAGIGLSFIPGVSASPVLSILLPRSVGIVNSFASSVMLKGYKRSFEYEADQEAVRLLQKSGYDSTAAISALEILVALEEREKRSPLKSVEALSTHPLLEKRIVRLKT
jgi:beta-barrel assembly-enhancing protease